MTLVPKKPETVKSVRKPKDIDTCATCKYSDGITAENRQYMAHSNISLVCMYHPPTSILVNGKWNSQYPVVDPRLWCFRYMPEDPTDE